MADRGRVIVHRGRGKGSPGPTHGANSVKIKLRHNCWLLSCMLHQLLGWTLERRVVQLGHILSSEIEAGRALWMPDLLGRGVSETALGYLFGSASYSSLLESSLFISVLIWVLFLPALPLHGVEGQGWVWVRRVDIFSDVPHLVNPRFFSVLLIIHCQCFLSTILQFSVIGVLMPVLTIGNSLEALVTLP